MPEEINRVVADILSFGVPVLPRTRKMAAGFKFDGKRAAGVSEVSATGGQAQPDPGGGPGGGVHPGRDAAGEHGEAGDCGCGGECAGRCERH